VLIVPYIKVAKLSGSHPLVLANAVQVRLIWSLNGKIACNVLGGSVTGGYVNSQTHADDLGTAVLARFTSSGLKALCATTTRLFGVGIRDVRTPNEVEYQSSASFVAGTGTGDPLPNEVAAVVTLRTARAGKSYRGRVYFSGADEDQNDSTQHMEGPYQTAVIAFLTGVQADMATEGIDLAVLSAPRYANLLPPLDIETWPGALTPVTSMQMLDGKWDSQRRRRI